MTGAVSYTRGVDWVPPVDFILEMDSSTSPAELYANTVWTQLKGCILFGAGNNFRAGSSGGNASVTMNVTNLPTHGHTIGIGSGGAHSHRTWTTASTPVTENTAGPLTSPYDYFGNSTATTSSEGEHTHTITVGSTGGGQTFSILNPYYAVNIWQRVG